MNNSSLWQDAIRRLLQNKAAIFGGVVIIIMSTLAIFAPFVAPYSYEFQFVDRIGQPPSAEHWLGTCLLYTSPSPRDLSTARMPSSA